MISRPLGGLGLALLRLIGTWASASGPLPALHLNGWEPSPGLSAAFVDGSLMSSSSRQQQQQRRSFATKLATPRRRRNAVSMEATMAPLPPVQTIAPTTPVGGSYGADKITVLEGLEPVRKRPGMYIGSTGVKGLHHLIFEVVDNSVDEALAGHCTAVEVTIEEDGSVTVTDDGRGIPCEVHSKTGRSALETVLTVLHAGGKFGGDASGYKVSGGLHGVGVSVVNALSESLTATVRRNGNLHVMRFARGVPLGDMEIRPDPEAGTVGGGGGKTGRPRSGTTISFKPDAEIFKTATTFEFDRVSGRLDELAYLNAGIRIVMADKRGEGRREEFFHEGGIREYVELMCSSKEKLHPEVDVIHAVGEKNGVTVEAALRWSRDQYDDLLIGFANGIRTGDGGTHLDGLKSVLTRTINNMARKSGKLKEGKDNLSGDFVREGLTAVVSVKVPDPEFEGQTKNRLGNPEVRGIVDAIIGENLVNTFEWNPKVLGAIVDKAMSAQQAAQAAKAARDMVRRKSLLSSTVLPGKLADCSSRDPTESEIYIVEGDSAAGSAKQGRDRRTQAILPLRGKILNIEKAATEKIYQNTELQALISALGLGIKGNEFDPATLRYHRIMIMTDADVDGSHIRILLLTFLFRYQRALVERGYIYIACPPLYKVTQGKNIKYAYSQEELEDVQASFTGKAAVSLQRFKGLGEMMPTQLWETTMNPETRILKQVTIEDAAEADKMFMLLMGDAVGPRKDFINRNAGAMGLDDLDF
ncbi:dna gyrase subunit b [Nannochloropsis oceanica]